MIEVLVRQHDMSNGVSRNLASVGFDRGRFDERAAGVDEQRSDLAAHKPDRDVAERQATAMHAGGQLLPGEMHKEDGSRDGGTAAEHVGKS